MEEIQQIVFDPVCGEEVEAETSLFQARYAGKTYHFCGMDCQLEFQEAPELYVGRYV